MDKADDEYRVTVLLVSFCDHWMYVEYLVQAAPRRAWTFRTCESWGQG